MAKLNNYLESKSFMTNIIDASSTGVLSTVSQDGYPHTTPVHYVYYNNKIYLHGSNVGLKINNIKNNGRVAFSIYKQEEVVIHENKEVCRTNTIYESIVIKGYAKIINDYETKKDALEQIIKKYTPSLDEKTMSDKMINATALIEISINEFMEKEYKG